VKRDLVPDELDERLIAWARYFRDRHRFERTRSIEGRFNPISEGSWDEGWGTQDEIPPQAPAPILDLPGVLQTHVAIHELPKMQKWAVTYGYCYPGLERWKILKLIGKYTGQRLTWTRYLDELEIARVKLWARLNPLNI
jgi:hypothetical protein